MHRGLLTATVSPSTFSATFTNHRPSKTTIPAINTSLTTPSLAAAAAAITPTNLATRVTSPPCEPPSPPSEPPMPPPPSPPPPPSFPLPPWQPDYYVPYTELSGDLGPWLPPSGLGGGYTTYEGGNKMYGSMSFISPVGRTDDPYQQTTFAGTRGTLLETGTTFSSMEEARDVCIPFCFNQTKQGEANHEYLGFGSGFSTYDQSRVVEPRGCNMVQLVTYDAGEIPNCYFWAEARAYQLQPAVAAAGREDAVWPRWRSYLYSREPFITEPPPSPPPPPSDPHISPLPPPVSPPAPTAPPPPPYPFDPVAVTCPMTYSYTNKRAYTNAWQEEQIFYNFSMSGFNASSLRGAYRPGLLWQTPDDTLDYTFSELDTLCCTLCQSINDENNGVGGWVDRDMQPTNSKCQAYFVGDEINLPIIGGYIYCLFFRGNRSMTYLNYNEPYGGLANVYSMHPLTEYIPNG